MTSRSYHSTVETVQASQAVHPVVGIFGPFAPGFDRAGKLDDILKLNLRQCPLCDAKGGRPESLFIFGTAAQNPRRVLVKLTLD